MSASIDPRWLAAVLLLSVRLGLLIAFSPLLTTFAVPVRVRLMLVFGLALMLAPTALHSVDARALSMDGFVLAVGHEVVNGGALALGVSVAFGAFSVAGRLVDQQIGFGIGQMLDPLNGAQWPVISAAFGYLAVVLFFLGDLHHLLMRGLILSVEMSPPGTALSGVAAMPNWIVAAGAMFGVGFAMVLPVMLSLLMVELVLSVIARNLPQMNIFVLSLPIKTLVGISALVVWLPLAAGATQRAFNLLFDSWHGLIT